MAEKTYVIQFRVKAESMEEAYEKLDEMLIDVIREEDGVASKVSQIDEELDDDYFVALAKEELGTAVRDNNRFELINIGKEIEAGTWDEES